MNGRKLLLREKVEVRLCEEGLQGSWHPGVVVGINDLCRVVEYDELLSEAGDSKLVESIPVTREIEGLYRRPCVKSNHRGHIRPSPPFPEHSFEKSRLSFGLCVDALFKEAWWEGIIFDSDDGADVRSVFFPDEGDVRRFKVSDLRITFDWNEFSGNWRERGVWTLVKLAKQYHEDFPPNHFIRHVWSCLRVNYGFLKMIAEWTCGTYCMWKQYYMEAICKMETKSIWQRLGHSKKSQGDIVREECESKTSQGSIQSSPILTTSSEKGSEKGSVQIVERKQIHLKNWLHSKKNWLPDSRWRNQNVMAIDVLQHSRRKCRVAERKLKQKGPLHVVTRKQKLKGYATNGSKLRKKIAAGLRSLVRERGNIMFPRKGKNKLAVRIPMCGQREGGRKVPYGFSYKKSRMKVKKIVPRRSQQAKANNKSSVKKEEETSGHTQKEEDNLVGGSHGAMPSTSSPKEIPVEDPFTSPPKPRGKRGKSRDSVCFVCQYGGELLHCDLCLSSFHLACIDLKEVPVGQWFCPSCCCGLCGIRNSADDSQLFTEVCFQCSRQYHVDCLKKAGISVPEDTLSEKFCSSRCFEIYSRLHELLQISNPTMKAGLTWTITRSRRNDCNLHGGRVHPVVQASQVLSVFHECFEPIIEPHTGRDLVADICYNSGSKFWRLDFHGFYVIALLNGEELVCVGTVRIHGKKVAEMPLIATRFKYRRKGMCRVLVHELEKMLIEMGVERLVLPGISQLSDTWVSSFGFSEMPVPSRLELLGYPFVVFQGTTMFERVLNKSILADGSKVSQKPQRNGTGILKESSARHESVSRYGRQYKRKKTPPEAGGKEKLKIEEWSRNPSTFKYVYKRRRVQATREEFST